MGKDGALLEDREKMKEISDIPDHEVSITCEGEEQSFDSGPGLLRAIGIPDVIITSGYLRNNQTYHGIKKGVRGAWDNVPFKEDYLIRERETGYCWRLTKEDSDTHFPYLSGHWMVVGGLFSRPPGGESLMDVIENRLYRFVDKICQKYSGKNVCLITHGRVKTGLRAILEDLSIHQIEEIINDPELGPKNVGLTSYKYDPWVGRLCLHSYNQTFH